MRWRADVKEQLNGKHRGTMPITRKIMTPVRKFPTNYEWNNYILSFRQKKREKSVSVAFTISPHITSCPAKQQQIFLAVLTLLGLGEVILQRPCLALSPLILQWLIQTGSGTLTQSWLGEIAVTSLRFWEEARPGIYASGNCGSLFWPRGPSASLPPLAIYSHTQLLLDGLGYPLEAMPASVLHPLPIFILGAEECPSH